MRGAQISDIVFLLFCYLSFVRIQPEILYNTRETFLSNQIITSRILQFIALQTVVGIFSSFPLYWFTTAAVFGRKCGV